MSHTYRPPSDPPVAIVALIILAIAFALALCNGCLSVHTEDHVTVVLQNSPTKVLP